MVQFSVFQIYWTIWRIRSESEKEGNIRSSKRHKRCKSRKKNKTFYFRGQKKGKGISCSSFWNDWHKYEFGMAKIYFGGFSSNYVNCNESESCVASIRNLELGNHLSSRRKIEEEPRKHVSILPVGGNCGCRLAARSPVNKEGVPVRVLMLL
jgi:hypothetical protein